MWKRMYLEPPHLMIAVYGEKSEIATFASAAAAIEAQGGEPTGVIKVAPRAEVFELIADLSDDARIIECDRQIAADLVAGCDVETRVVRALYRHPGFGHVVLQYLPNSPGDRHPIAVVASAEALGLPMELWAADDHIHGPRLARQSRALLREVVMRSESLYGGISVELGLPTPADVSASRGPFPTEGRFSRWKHLLRGVR